MQRYLRILISIALICCKLLPNSIQTSENVFAYEYGNIAKSLVEKASIANPFYIPKYTATKVQESPETKVLKSLSENKIQVSAWMQPLYVFVEAIVFKLAGVKTKIAAIILFSLKLLFISLSLCLIIKFISEVAGDFYSQYLPWIITLAFIFLIFVGPGTIATLGYDHTIQVLFITACLTSIYFFLDVQSPKRKSFLYLTAALVPLVSPVAAFAFLVSLVFFLPNKKVIFLSFSLMLLSSSLWMYRNYRALEIIAPIKSNFWFDFYQANVLDDDGIVNQASFNKSHPMFNSQAFKNYYELGEKDFLAPYKKLSLDYVYAKPLEYLSKCLTRFVNIFIYLKNFAGIFEVNANDFIESDLNLLLASGIISRDIQTNRLYWINLEKNADQVKAELENIGLAKTELIISKWQIARENAYKRKIFEGNLEQGILFSLLPSLCLIFGFSKKYIRKYTAFKLTATFYISAMLPFILCSHYTRYQAHFVGIQLIIICLVIIAWLNENIFYIRNSR